MEDAPLIIGKCPKCGSPVLKTCKGFRCQGEMLPVKTCDFILNSMICNRRLSDAEAQALLLGQTLLLDGFAKNDGKIFSSTIRIDDAGAVQIDSRVAVCPKCGGTVFVGTKAFNCANQAAESKCGFVVWRNYSGHEVTLDDIRALCTKGVTDTELPMYSETGKPYAKRLALSPEKDKVVRI